MTEHIKVEATRGRWNERPTLDMISRMVREIAADNKFLRMTGVKATPGSGWQVDLDFSPEEGLRIVSEEATAQLVVSLLQEKVDGRPLRGALRVELASGERSWEKKSY